MDISPLFHTCAALLIQVLFGYFFGRWGYGGIIGCMWFIAREHTQAEYRWIAAFGHGKRVNMPWWGGFDIRVWNVGSLLDFLVPVIVCVLVFAIAVYSRNA